MDFKNKITEIITQTHRTPVEQAEEIIQLLTENDNYKQLLQSCVSGSLLVANGPMCNKGGTGTYCSKCGHTTNCNDR